jgi:hypothetical protein
MEFNLILDYISEYYGLDHNYPIEFNDGHIKRYGKTAGKKKNP